MNLKVLLQSYIVIARTVSVLSIAASLYLQSLAVLYRACGAAADHLVADGGAKAAFQVMRDEAAIDGALKFAGINCVDKDELLGKDTGGTDLSGGQWQKLAIARAAYRSRNFIILDEPTSNLDPLAEAEVFAKYMEMSKDKTVINVTHRISVAALADRIVVFANGRIVQDGTHEELIRQEGEYARLYNGQTKWYNW